MGITIKEYRNRIKLLSSSLRRLGHRAAILLPAADRHTKSHDQHFPFSQDKDFLYFTGLSTLQNAAFFLASGDSAPIIFVRKVSETMRTWEGGEFDIRKAGRALGATILEVDELLPCLRDNLRGIDTLYLNPARSNLAAELSQSLLQAPLYELQAKKLPTALSHSQLLTAPLRAIKSPTEIQLIRNAVSLTESALVEVLRITRPGCTELQLARLFEGLVREAGGRLAFEPIVATGANAAVLHHSPTTRKLKKGELVLFDVGAELEGYNGDLSRTVSLGANKQTEKLLLEVDYAQEQIAKLIKIGASYQKIKTKAVEIMASRLAASELPTKGPAQRMIKTGEIRKFFPHSFGHSLGLDVHDPIPPDSELEAGMVFTVEPGIYLSKKLGRFQPFGIRIEDDFFVSKTGPKIFSSIPQLISI